MIVLRNSECYLKWDFKGFQEATSLPLQKHDVMLFNTYCRSYFCKIGYLLAIKHLLHVETGFS